MALLFALARKVAFYHQQTKSGRYKLNDGPPLRRISGQTLGIVGLGNIGRRVAEKAIAFGLRAIAADTNHGNAMPGVDWCELNDLLAQADYVSLHLPLGDATRNLIGTEQFGWMKHSAYLINRPGVGWSIRKRWPRCWARTNWPGRR